MRRSESLVPPTARGCQDQSERVGRHLWGRPRSAALAARTFLAQAVFSPDAASLSLVCSGVPDPLGVGSVLDNRNGWDGSWEGAGREGKGLGGFCNGWRFGQLGGREGLMFELASRLALRADIDFDSLKSKDLILHQVVDVD
jgi:hypothetical protein